MKFTRPISREIEIQGNAFIVIMDESGVDLRLKGKRRTVRADWATIFETSRSENGEPPNEYLGLPGEETPTRGSKDRDDDARDELSREEESIRSKTVSASDSMSEL